MAEAYLDGSADTIKVDHVFTFKLDRSLRKTSDKLLELLSDYAESFRYIAIGLSAYLILSGVAQLASSVGTVDEPSSKHKKKSHKKDKSESSSAPKAESKPEAATESSANTEGKATLEPPK